VVRLILPRPSDRCRGLAGEDPALVPDGAPQLGGVQPAAGDREGEPDRDPAAADPGAFGARQCRNGAGPGGSELARLLTVPSQGKLPAVTL
jgi:hypothetical protein